MLHFPLFWNHPICRPLLLCPCRNSWSNLIVSVFEKCRSWLVARPRTDFFHPGFCLKCCMRCYSIALDGANQYYFLDFYPAPKATPHSCIYTPHQSCHFRSFCWLYCCRKIETDHCSFGFPAADFLSLRRYHRVDYTSIHIDKPLFFGFASLMPQQWLFCYLMVFGSQYHRQRRSSPIRCLDWVNTILTSSR